MVDSINKRFVKRKLKDAIDYHKLSERRHIHLSSDRKIDMLQLLKELDQLIDG